jgi:hypothetical protein
MLYAAGAIFFLFYLVASLLGGSGSKGSPPPAASLPHLPATPPPAHGASPLDTVRSLVFWAIALGIVLYSLSVLWRKRGPGLGSLPLGRILRVPFAILGAVLGFMLRLGRGVGVAIAAAVPRLFRAAPPVARQPLRFLSLSRLGPRELVEYFYLSVCERAAQLGLPRPPGMTPVEYQALLRERLPLVDPELDAVTAAFLRARYGPRPTTTEEARQARGPWDVLKRKLRAARLARRETGARQESERT